MKEVSKAITFMTALIGSCLAAVLLGSWLDQKLHCSPVLTLMLLAYAIGGNFYLLWKGLTRDE